VGRVGVAAPIPQVEPIPAAQGRLERMMTGPTRFSRGSRLGAPPTAGRNARRPCCPESAPPR
jgi:hypothetical protein